MGLLNTGILQLHLRSSYGVLSNMLEVVSLEPQTSFTPRPFVVFGAKRPFAS